MAYDSSSLLRSIASDGNQTAPHFRATAGTEGVIVDLDIHRQLGLRLRALAKLCELNDNWDGYGSVAPKTSAIAMAQRFVPELLSENRPLPNTIKPDGEGGVSLVWDINGSRIIVSFDGAEIHMSRELADGSFELPAPHPYYSSGPQAIPQDVLNLIR